VAHILLLCARAALSFPYLHILPLCARAALSLFIFCIEEVTCLIALAPLLATVAKGSVLKSSTISLSHKIIFEIFCGVFC
jgi:hypothetical protein